MSGIAKMMGDWDVTLQRVTKRLGDPNTEERGFYARFIWEAVDRKSDDIIRCEWEGFATADECLADLAENYEEQP